MLKQLEGKHIVLAITGSIAAYKAAVLLRLFIKQGAEVQVIMTPAAKEFITPLTLATLSQKPVISEFFEKADGQWHSHVDLGLWADAFVVAPASASTIAKMAHGIADNMLLTSYLSTRAKCFVAPAMDLDMYAHSANQSNLKILSERGVEIIEPTSGFLASTLEGKGRMEEPENILKHVISSINRGKILDKKKILITSGPTVENIDPVRFISNYSSGKMGTALAHAASEMGAEVYFITGPARVQAEDKILKKKLLVNSAKEMYDAVMEVFNKDIDIAIFCAAVSDYRVAEIASEKIKREKKDEMLLKLIKNPDIAAEIGKRKSANQYLLGFALETSDGRGEALAKMKRKHLNAIVLNSLMVAGAGFGVDTNQVNFLRASGEESKSDLLSKTLIAEQILQWVKEDIDKQDH